MRVCLGTPPLISDNPREPIGVPLGIAYLAAVLERAGIEVTLEDGPAADSVTELAPSRYLIGATPSQIATRIAATKPDLIGLSCPFTTRYRLFRDIIRELRNILPRTPIVVGGMHPTLFPERLLLNDHADMVVLGEGETTFLTLVTRFADTGRLEPDGLDGVAWSDNGSVRVVPRKQYIDDLDSLPPPARHLLPIEVYLARSGGRWSARRRRVLSILTSRSCPGRCSFCSVHSVFGPIWRAHSAERVLWEIKDITSKYNPDLIAFEDDRLTWDRQRLLAICRGIVAQGINLKWFTPNGVHVDDLDEELLGAMRQSGCASLNLAIESGDADILHRVIGKKGSDDNAREIVEFCRRLGIRTNGYFVIGMPGDTDQTIQRTLDLCLDLQLDGLGVFIATPFPGTRMFEDCVARGYIDPAKFVEEFLEAGDPDLLHRPLFDTPTMSRERLLWWEREFTAQFQQDLQRRHPLLMAGRRMQGLLRQIRRSA